MKQCYTCARWWHTQCGGLYGLKDLELNKLIEWNCPLCLMLPAGVTRENCDCEFSDLEATIKGESKKVIKLIKDTVKSDESLKTLVSDTVKGELNANLHKQSTSIGHLLQTNREQTTQAISEVTRNLAETINDNNSEVVRQVVKTSKAQMDSDTLARDQRKCNLIIRKVEEPDGESNRAKYEQDKQFAIGILGITEQEFIKVRRAGEPREDVCRPMIITVASPQLAAYHHNYGKGYRARLQDGSVFWINPDLIQADREANYKARMLARNRRNGGRGRNDLQDTEESSESVLGSPHPLSPTPTVTRLPLINGNQRRGRGRRSHAPLRNSRSRSRSLESQQSDFY